MMGLLLFRIIKLSVQVVFCHFQIIINYLFNLVCAIERELVFQR